MRLSDEMAALADAAALELKAALLRIVAALEERFRTALRGMDTLGAEQAAKLGKDAATWLRDLGYQDAVNGVLTRFETIVQANEAFLSDQLGASLSILPHRALDAFANGVADHLISLEGKAAEAMRSALLLASSTNVDLGDLPATIAREGGIKLREGLTELRTALMAFHREVQVSTAEEVGFDLFVYTGPDDDVIRPFCAQHVDRVFTADDLDALDNGQGLEPTSVYLGGYQCRHSLAPVTTDDAVAEGLRPGGAQARSVMRRGVGPNERSFVAANRGRILASRIVR